MKQLIILILLFLFSCAPKLTIHRFDGTEKYYGTIHHIDYIFFSLPNQNPAKCMLIHADSGMLRLSQYNCNIDLDDKVWIHEIPITDFIIIPVNAVINGYEYSIKQQP